jgi:hypothetical protein
MTETDARTVLTSLHITDTSKLTTEGIDRAIQTAKQIGSSWPTSHINLIYHCYDNDLDFWRIIIE